MELVLVVVGIIALASVMTFLARRPGRRQRSEIVELINSATAQSTPGDLDHDIEVQINRMAPLPEHCVFISYRRADTAELVGRLDDHLARSLGRAAIFKDVDSLKAGQDFRQQIERSLATCKVFICVIGATWAGPREGGIRSIDDTGDFVRLEIEAALKRGTPIIPLLARGIRMPAAETFPETLRQVAYLQGLPLRHDPDFRGDVVRVIRSVLALLPAR